MMNFSNEGWDGSKFHDFHVRKDSTGPGWFIFGRNAEKYGRDENGKGRYVMLCGYVQERRHPHYNGKVRHGWRLKKEAQSALDAHLASYPFLNQN